MSRPGQTPRCPMPEELDRAAGGRAVYLSRVDVHSALVSSSLASAAGLADLDGYASSGARQAGSAYRRPPVPPASFPDGTLRGYQQRALAEAAANGYVAVAEMGAPHIGGVDDLRLAASWNNGGHGAGPAPEVLPYWGELAGTEEQAQALLDQPRRSCPRAGRRPEHRRVRRLHGPRPCDPTTATPRGSGAACTFRLRKQRRTWQPARCWASRADSMSLAMPAWTRPWRRLDLAAADSG